MDRNTETEPLHDDNRDNRMPSNKRSNGRDESVSKGKDRSPTHIAYSVKGRGQDQDAIWRSVGAAFTHKDGKGMDVVLDAMPTDGRVTLREQRREDFKEQRREGQSRSRSRGQTQGRER